MRKYQMLPCDIRRDRRWPRPRRAMGAMCLVLLLIAVTAPVTWAQNGCPGLRVRDEAAARLDEQALCAAAQPWIERGLQVFVFVTDVRPASEDEWFALRDTVEADWGIYNAADQTFAKTALAVEVTTDTSKPWGHDLAFGEALFGTPLDDDATIQRLEGRLKNGMAAGDPAAAIMDALAATLQTAFPAAQPGAAPPAVDVPAAPAAETRAGSTLWGWLATPLVAGAAILVGALLVVPGVIMPVLRRRRALEARRRHLADLQRKVKGLLYGAATLFTGEATEETTLWRLFLVYGGAHYAGLTAEVRGWVEHAMSALREALLLSQDLEQQESATRDAEVTEQIRAYELLYLTLVGTDPRLLAMDEDAFRTFIDPLAGGLPQPAADPALVAQIRALRQQLAEQPLRIDLLIVDPRDVDADGIFGYAARIKDVLARLNQAQAEAPAALHAAHNARERAASELVLPDGWEAATAFAAVDRALAAADEAAGAERWLDVEERVAAATALMEQLGALMPEAVRTLARYREQLEEVRAIAARGYRLGFLDEGERQCAELIAALRLHVEDGDPGAARRTLEDLEAQSTTLVLQAQALVESHEHNTAELCQLAAEVARVEALRTGEAGTAWTALQAYPASNWQDLAGRYEAATLALGRLFDEPTNPDDLASAIERANSLEQQAFDTAARELAAAFAAVAEAESGLQALIARLQEVRTIEGNAAPALDAARADLERAVARRDRDAAKIDAEVDRRIEAAGDALREAGERLAGREFLAAGDLIGRVRTLATEAYAAADEQARALDEAYRRLEASRMEATRTLQTARQEAAGLPPAAVSPATLASYRTAEEQLQHAGREDRELQGKEDRALLAAIEAAIARHAAAERAARQALAQVRSDAAAYQNLIGSAEAALRAAQGAIASAQGYTGAADAGGAGRAALQQALALLQPLPTFGSPVDHFQRVMTEARRTQELAELATRQARARIGEVQAARAAEQRRRDEAERRRREDEAAARRQRESLARAATRLSTSAHRTSARSSSLGSSRASRSSSMGSSRRR